MLDLGCGELLLQVLAAAPNARGVGVDADAVSLAHARELARQRGLAGRVTVLDGDARTQAPAHADAVICIGASHIWGQPVEAEQPLDYGAALAALRSTVERGARVVHGYVLTACGDTLADLGDPAGPTLLDEARSLLDRCLDPGLVGRYLTRTRARHGLPGPPRPGRARLVDQLTDRELAVLRYLPSALSQRDVATELFVSLNTVKTHCQAIYRKLGVTDRRAAIQAAHDHQLL